MPLLQPRARCCCVHSDDPKRIERGVEVHEVWEAHECARGLGTKVSRRAKVWIGEGHNELGLGAVDQQRRVGVIIYGRGYV